MRHILCAFGTFILLISNGAVASNYETISKTANAGQLLRALLQAGAWLETEPNNVYARSLRANIHTAFVDPVMVEEAIADYTAIMNSTAPTPDRLSAQRARAQVYARLQKFDNALADVEYLFRVGPQPYLSYAVRGEVYVDKGKFREALADADEGLSMRPDHTFFHYLRGRALIGLEKYEEGIQALERYLKDSPDSSGALWFQGFGYLKLGRTEAAALNARRLGGQTFAGGNLMVVYDVEKRRNTVAALLQSGRQHEANGNWQSAWESYTSAYNWAGRRADDRERAAHDEARKEYMRIFHRWGHKNYRSDLAKGLINEAEAHLTNGRYDQAIATFTRLTIWIPYLPTPYYNMALIYAQHKEFGAAITHMRTFLELEPNAPDRKAIEDAMGKWQDALSQAAVK